VDGYIDPTTQQHLSQEILMKISNAVLAGTIGVLAARGCASRAQAPQDTVKNIVLVHGAFADGSSWAKVIPILESRGFTFPWLKPSLRLEHSTVDRLAPSMSTRSLQAAL
jgi:hypothetical protein